MQLSDFAQALGAAQQLVPSYEGMKANALAMRGADLQNQVLQRQLVEADAEQAEKATFLADLKSLGGNATPDQYWRLAARHPTLKGIGDAAAAMTDAQRRTTVGHAGQIHAALQNNRTDLAKQLVQRSIDASRNSGEQPDQDDVDLLAAINSGDPEQIAAVKGGLYAIIAASNPNTAASNINDATSEQKDFTLAPGGRRFKADGTLIAEAPFAPQYRSVSEGETLVEVGGEGGGPVSGGGGGAGGTPRNVRNNNPGNIIDSPFARSQPGYQGGDGRFAKFATPEAGKAAQGALLGSYIDRGFNTVEKIINRWAPPSENDTGAYVRSVAKELGVKPSDPLTKAAIPRLQAAITRVEGGPGSSSNGGSEGRGTSGGRVVFKAAPKNADPVDDATVNFYADKVAAGGDLPALGSGKEASAWRQAILKRAAAIQQGRGMTGADSNLRFADARAARQALVQLQKTRSNVEGFEQTFQANVKEVLRLAPTGVAGGRPVFNRWVQNGRRNVKGDPAIAAFDVAVNTAANEYAKLASGASGGAVTSDSARHEAMEILNTAQTLPQLRAAIAQMQRDGHNRVVALNQQEARLRSTITGKREGASSNIAAGEGGAPRRAPAGGRLIGTYQGKPVYQLPNGKRVVAR